MKTVDRKRWKRIEPIVRQVIHEWDPYGLIAMGCPADEFDQEILSVVGQMERIKSNMDAAQALSRVFSSAFERKGFTSEDCREPGEKLFNALRDARFIEDGGSA